MTDIYALQSLIREGERSDCQKNGSFYLLTVNLQDIFLLLQQNVFYSPEKSQ